jgi:phosphoenolpyruvate carboxylase
LLLNVAMTIQNNLKHLVFQSVKLLGEAIKDLYGPILYQQVEELRVKMKDIRSKSPDAVQKALDEVYHDLKKDTNDDLRQIAKAFSLMLELINTCEAAYRSHRLKDLTLTETKTPDSIIYVFTSHPTESRSHDFLELMGQIESLLIEALDKGFQAIEGKLTYLLRIAVRLSLSNNRRPQVKDEMEQVFHVVLDAEILKEQIELKRRDISVYFRTWVGGDKDGHPKVGSSTMRESFTLSRSRLMNFIVERLNDYEKEVTLIADGHDILHEIKKMKNILKSMKKIEKMDGHKIVLFKASLAKLHQLAEAYHLFSPAIEQIEILSWLYPALVLPLEIREDSELIHKALKNNTEPIAKMLKTLKIISEGMDPKWYVRGFIISMCQTAEDIIAAYSLTKKNFGGLSIPVVPLFENEKGLRNAIEILEKAFKKIPLKKEHTKRWSGRFEVMVGYSDSSKENGVLPARLLIENALFELEEFLIKERLTPIFFHGSGGSTSRGGGSVQEQISWWPQSALDVFKVTIQGEMIQRNFNTPQIMRSQAEKIITGYKKFRPRKPMLIKEMKLLSQLIQESYRNLVNDERFQEVITFATPYDYLNLLKIGSRPAKRSTKGKFSLRAIPWILCWTQTRLLLPVWWGTGSSWKNLSAKEKEKIKKFYTRSALFQTYIKNLGFTLAKIELGVWNFHLDHSKLPEDEKNYWRSVIDEELKLSIAFFKEVSGQHNFTWFRPWLGESIHFRSSMIHPLNVIQKLALERNDRILLRETVTGIACGMLTTG